MSPLKITDKYNDIINLPHHRSEKHPSMTMINRAAQFSPFAALTGHDAAIKETARLTDERIELDESAKAIIDKKLQFIEENIKNKPVISVTYFEPDERKKGGEYVIETSAVNKIDSYAGCLVMQSGHIISIDEIIEIIII